MPNNLTDNEIKKALEEEANDKICEYQRYEVACGVWCSLKGIACDDMNGIRRIDSCKEYLPVPYIVKAKATLDLINRLQADVENYKQIAEHQQSVTLDRGFEIKRLKEKIERLERITRTMVGEIKAEAYKEFADLLCGIWQRFEDENICGISNQGLVKFVCKEMVGEDNANTNK